MRQTMEQHKAEYRARPLSERLDGVFAEAANLPEQSPAERALERVVAHLKVPSKEYKPAHGGYPG